MDETPPKILVIVVDETLPVRELRALLEAGLLH
jgi:hypothetical protein